MSTKIRSQEVTEGPAKAGARAMLRAVGLGEDDFDRPQVGVVSAGNEVTPCNLPLVPAYVAHLAGVSGEADDLSAQRGVTFRHSVAFVLGFSALFIFLGASVGALGFFVRDNLETLEKIAGVLLIVMGLNLMRVINIPWLYRTYQVELPGSPSSKPA